MVRTLFASLAVSMTSIAMACDTCGCSTPAECTGAKTTTVADDAKACAESCTDKTDAVVMAVSNTTDGEACTETCTKTCDGEASVTALVSNAEGEACTETCTKTCDGEASTTSLVSNTEGESCSEPCTETCDGSDKASGFSLVTFMPKMTYSVGGADTCCPKTAATMAKDSNEHVHYVVNNVSYDSKAEAMDAHAKQLNSYMMDLVRIQYAVDGECVACPTAAKELADSCESKKMQYKVGPATFDSAEAAINASIMAYNAAQKVSMQYAVGDEVTTCTVSAKDMAKKADCSVEYVVNGQRTNCVKTAGYLKTVASVESALKALETAAAATTATDA